MRLFSLREEERLYELELARGWARTGLLSASELARVEAEGEAPRLVAGWPVRLLFAGLAGVVLLASADLLGLFRATDSSDQGWLLIVLAGASALAGELLVRAFRLHRFGAEEFLLTCAPALAALGAAFAAGGHNAWHFRVHALRVAGAVAAAGYAALYLRARYPLAAAGAVGGLTLFALAGGPAHPRMIALALWAVVLAGSFLVPVDEPERETWEFLQGALALMLALLLNLRVEQALWSAVPARGSGFAYWASYAAVWLAPWPLLAAGARLRHRAFLCAGAVALLAALCTNKPYLGLARQPWDPALLGLLLMAAGSALMRWLDAGEGGTRGGVTSKELVLARDGGLSTLAAWAGAGLGQAAAPQPGPADGPAFGGGSAGGGGASGSF